MLDNITHSQLCDSSQPSAASCGFCILAVISWPQPFALGIISGAGMLVSTLPAMLVFPTKVPQYIFEEAVASGGGGKTNIIICQPRRIAAVGLATRVADEVGDAAGVGGLVGYSVRLDTKSSQYTRMLFCTTGVLLRRLMNDPNLEGGWQPLFKVSCRTSHQQSAELSIVTLEQQM